MTNTPTDREKVNEEIAKKFENMKDSYAFGGKMISSILRARIGEVTK